MAIHQIETHVSGMTGRGGPEIGMENRMNDCSIASGAFAEDTALAFAAAAESLFNEGHGLLQQKIVPAADPRAVDILIAAELTEAVRKRDDAGRHRAASDQPVQPLGHVLAEILPVGVSRSTGSEADNINKQWKSAPVMTVRHIDVDNSRCGIVQWISGEHFAVECFAVYGARGRGNVAYHGPGL